MIASRPWLGITKPEWLIKSDTPQLGSSEGYRKGYKGGRQAHHAMTRMRGLLPSEREIAQPQVRRGEKDGHRSYDGAFPDELPE